MSFCLKKAEAAIAGAIIKNSIIKMEGSTIAAICTPRGFGGVGIIKISGPDSVRIAQKIFRTRHAGFAHENLFTEKVSSFKANRLRYGVVVKPENGSRIDEVLLSTMLAPKSYTGEDVVEINAHAGPVVIDAILETVLSLGAELAQPGEFTRRAFLNGRIDLTQAEAVSDLINAKTTASADMATALMAGRLGVEIEQISEHLKRLISYNEALIDFPEDIEEETVFKNDVTVLKKDIVAPLQDILGRFREGRIFRDGLRLAVVGRPNVGKSSLMNRLVKEDRVIVTDMPGTTRDAVEDVINIKGVPVVIIDTAGLQETENPVEIMGIEKTLQNIKRADLILFVVEEGRGIQGDDHEIYRKIEDKELFIVINKKDLEGPVKRTRIPDQWKKHEHIRVSALTGAGIELLESQISAFVTGDSPDPAKRDFAPNVRQKILIQQSLKSALAAIESKERGDSGELTALDLDECLDGLDQILGNNLKEDLLDRIFSEFCVGK